MRRRTGGHILADQLKIQGVERVFCLPGESFLELLDGLYEHRDSIQVITTRHEGGAANMAEASAKLTGRPGVCLVTRGPGATNASIGIHTAFQDSTPVILLIGQVGRSMVDREAFQEIDFRRMYGEMAKWVAQIDSSSRIPGIRQPGVSRRSLRTPGSGGACLAGGYASRRGQCGGWQTRASGASCAFSPVHGNISDASARRRISFANSRRRHLDRRSGYPDHGIRGSESTTSCSIFSLPGLF